MEKKRNKKTIWNLALALYLALGIGICLLLSHFFVKDRRRSVNELKADLATIKI